MLMNIHLPCGRAVEDPDNCKWCNKTKKSPQARKRKVNSNQESGENEPSIADS